jgi:hypothetical protein
MPTIASRQTIAVQPNSVQSESILYNLRPDENGEAQRASVPRGLSAESNEHENSSADIKAPGAVLQQSIFVKQ